MRTQLLIFAAFLSTCGQCQAETSGEKMQRLGKLINACLAGEAKVVARKDVDLETATVAVLARCSPAFTLMRQHVTTGIPNFVPPPDFWDKQLAPAYTKAAREAVALVRTR